MKNLLYIGYFDISENSAEKRSHTLSASNKMSYIISALERTGHNVNILSTSQTLMNRKLPGKRIAIRERVVLHLPTSIGNGNKLKRLIDRILIRMRLLFELVFNNDMNSTVIVYHSLSYLNTIKIAHRLKHFPLIIEVEEIYGDVMGSKKTVQKELKYFRLASGYIFPTELLNEKINTADKPHSIIHGTYQVEKNRDCKFNDGKIHCVYAGTFDPRKGGAAAAAAAAEFLDELYHIHIIGFGSESDKQNILRIIEDVSKRTKCTITFDGLKSGDEYIHFLQSCDIGLSTQTPSAAFNDTSFPSKVLSYMANGLRVVSIKIKALETSAVNDLLYYYEEDNPLAIAQAIKMVNVHDDYDSRKKISELDMEFCENIKKLIWMINNDQ